MGLLVTETVALAAFAAADAPQEYQGIIEEEETLVAYRQANSRTGASQARADIHNTQTCRRRHNAKALALALKQVCSLPRACAWPKGFAT